MTKRKKRKKKFEPFQRFFRHAFPSLGHLNGLRRTITLLVLLGTAGSIFTPAAPGSSQNPANSHAHDFVIFATVFTEHGFALPGARVRVRRADEQKFRWEALSDRRGELGIRVKQGAEYELTIEARGFQPQTRKIDAREGDREDLTLQMEKLAGGKP